MLVRETVLMHYGVKGMKWGVRRYQNKDGSLTSKGKKHYTDDVNADVNTSKSKNPLNATNKILLTNICQTAIPKKLLKQKQNKE